MAVKAAHDLECLSMCECPQTPLCRLASNHACFFRFSLCTRPKYLLIYKIQPFMTYKMLGRSLPLLGNALVLIPIFLTVILTLILFKIFVFEVSLVID